MSSHFFEVEICGLTHAGADDRRTTERPVSGFRGSGRSRQAGQSPPIDLVLERPDGTRWAIEIKRGLAAKLERGFHHARQDLAPAQSFVVYSGEERYPTAEGVEAISVREMAEMLASLQEMPRIPLHSIRATS